MDPWQAGIFLMTRSIAIPSLAGGKFHLHDEPWFAIELAWPHHAFQEWLRTHLYLSYCIALLYIAVVFTGQRAMANNKPFDLRRIMVVWNLFLAVFSVFFAVRFAPISIMKIRQQTFYGLICDASIAERVPQVLFCTDLFRIFKLVEFFDTAFIVLRKQKLAFIHWYHHATVFVLCWHSYCPDIGPSNSAAFMEMNSIVHSVMYTYFAFRAGQIRVPRMVNMAITAMQIAQMFVGLFLSLAAAYFVFLRDDRPCDDHPRHAPVALAVYLSYALLFCQFFYNTYVSNHQPQASNLQRVKTE